MLNQLLTRALGQAFRQAPKAAKASRRVGVPTRSAGIGGRMGPGGGGLETGVVARPITRPSSVNVRPNNTPYTGTLQPNTAPSYLGSQTSSKGSLLKTGGGLMGGAGLIELGLMGVDAIGQAVNPEFARKRSIQQQYQDTTGDPGFALTTEEMQNYLNSGTTTDPLAMRARYGGSGDMDAGPGGPSTLSELTAPSTLNGIAGIVDVNPKTGKGIPGTFRRGDMDAGDPVMRSAPPQLPEPPVPTREELEKRAYQQEVSRVAQQADPFFRAGGAPTLNYSADEGMAISRGLYGDQLTPKTPNPLMAGLVYDETNPMMQGRNYNMENPVGVQQSSAQSLADYYRNGMMEQQTQGMGSEPGLESVLSPEDREMFLQRLSGFRPGGPG